MASHYVTVLLFEQVLIIAISRFEISRIVVPVNKYKVPCLAIANSGGAIMSVLTTLGLLTLV
ncbi:hypothetical protein KHA80_22375 [Anaerobacillus sp. HL2]|nr:hypothetical protein KHA80_22375 [Anaerobacillus sp. HL2]